MSGVDRAIAGQAEAWLVKLIERKLEAGEGEFTYESELEAEQQREFGYPRGPCTPRNLPR